MPARRAISSVDAPARPRSANSTRAASRISSRRSSFVFRSLTTMGVRLVTTHKLVKGLRHPVEIALREPGVEGQGKRAVEGMLGARERARVPVGPEERECVGADLRLDPLSAERGQDLVAALDLDYVG